MDIELTIEELAQQANVPVRTVRYYIAEGIIPGAESRGKGASYGEEHLVKLLLARKLADRRVLLADIKEQVPRLTSSEARTLLEQEEQQERELRLSEDPSPREYLSSLLQRARETAERARETAADGQLSLYAQSTRRRQRRMPPNQSGPGPAADSWRRIELAPGLELHIRSDVEAPYSDLIRRLIEQARTFHPTR